MLPALSIAIPIGCDPVVAQLAVDTGSKGTVVSGDVVAGKEETGVVAVGADVDGAVVAAGT